MAIALKRNHLPYTLKFDIILPTHTYDLGDNMNRNEQYSLLLLAGGKSSRMGRNKAELCYTGKTFLEINAAKGQQLGIHKIYVSGFSGCAGQTQIVWDLYPDRGPLGGLHACMKQMHTPFCLILPIDAPRLDLQVLEELLNYHQEHREGLKTGREIPLIWEHGDRKEPLIAIYPVEMADAIGDRIKEQPASVFSMIDSWGYECFKREIPMDEVVNVNTPELYRELIQNEMKD